MKVKKVSYELVEQESPAGKRIYPLVARLVEAHHEHLANARIAIAWCTSWNPDVDGRVTLGKCKRASDLDRELMPLDFVILLARWFYESGDVTDAQREALLDHELCHAEVVMDRDEPKLDERGRIVYRTRKHDIEEFAEIVLRHGTYTSATWRPSPTRCVVRMRPMATGSATRVCSRVCQPPGSWYRSIASCTGRPRSGRRRNGG